ncbi:hypothetical protein AVEN_44059-1 [Araneus ventricosus]|uniref:Uncharacterized protein n=1 Tax=Araneus ventricosus TaxID=182803 RepID=A0A4Y2H9B9_ARAVE|nr:hypothetical protein AVEN_44059-1 [Araneus ventricosus]
MGEFLLSLFWNHRPFFDNFRLNNHPLDSVSSAMFRPLLPPNSNFSLQQSYSIFALQICQLAASLTRQECKLETSSSKRASHHASNLSQASRVKLIANDSKNRVRRQPRIRTLDIPLSKL